MTDDRHSAQGSARPPSRIPVPRGILAIECRGGANAVIEAARFIDRMLDLGDREGQFAWRQIMRAIEALQAPASGGEALRAGRAAKG
jgi:hypothetical protein